MIKLLTNALIRFCEKTNRVLTITGTAGPDDVYLVRYFVIRSKYFNFFIHRFLRSDRDDLHDHPWNFMTYLVDGAYKEKKWNPSTGEIEVMVRENYTCWRDWSDSRLVHHQRNSLVFRKATDQHQVVVFNELKPHEIKSAALTICITGPTIREWGFIKEREPKHLYEELDVIELSGKVREWIPWKKYLGLPEDTPGRG